MALTWWQLLANAQDILRVWNLFKVSSTSLRPGANECDYPAHVKQCGSNQQQQGVGCVFNCRKMFLFVFMSVNFRAWFNSTFVFAHFKCSSAIFFWCSEWEFDFNCSGAETQILWMNEINSMVTNVLIPCITRTLKAMILKCRKIFVLVLYEEGKKYLCHLKV